MDRRDVARRLLRLAREMTAVSFRLKKVNRPGAQTMWVAEDREGLAHGFITKSKDTRDTWHPYQVFKYNNPWVVTTAEDNPGNEHLGDVYVADKRGLEMSLKFLKRGSRFREYGEVSKEFGYNASTSRTAGPYVDMYRKIKREVNRPGVLLVKMGDYYEAFDDDAKILAQVAGASLTKRKGIVQSGVSKYDAKDAIKALKDAGHKVMVVEDPAKEFDI